MDELDIGVTTWIGARVAIGRRLVVKRGVTSQSVPSHPLEIIEIRGDNWM